MKKIYFVFILFILQISSFAQTRSAGSVSDTVDILKYTINLNITDFVTNTIAGNTEIKYTPKMNGVNKLNLDLLVLTLDSVKSSSSVLTYNYNDTLLGVNLPNTYNIGDTSYVTVYYHGTPQIDHPSGWGGFYFSSGYAFNLGVGFDALPHNYGRTWFPCFDNFVERSKYEFNITTNGGKTSYCNGYVANDTMDGSGNRTRKWVMNEEIPSYLACVAVATYAEVNQSYNGINGTIPIKLAALPADTTNMKNSFINLPVALSTFENHFGPFMWNKVGYSLVPFSSGAMEHATNISYPRVCANGTTLYQSIMAHELSHHWFGDLATCRTAQDMWLNEGWATYCEYLFSESLSGYNSYIASVRNQHSINLQFLHYKESGYQSLANIPLNITYGDHVYKKGADIAHTLRGYLGDSLFFYSVKTYLANNNYKDVSSADFRDALTVASGINMNDFFDGWVFNGGWPHFSIDSTVVVPSGTNFVTTVYVKQKLTGAPSYFNNVPLEVTFKKNDWTENVQTLIMTGSQASFNFTLPFNPIFSAINMGEKISHAVAPEYKTIKTIGSKIFANAKMTINVTSIVDSAFIRVEHNFVKPDAYKHCCIPYRLSDYHYWKVDGILPSVFKAKATLKYEGRTSAFSGDYWLDNTLITAAEDSLVLMYRANAGDEWHVYPFYTKLMGTNHNDKTGSITIDTLQLGEYAFAMMDYTMGINANSNTSEMPMVRVFPNPANEIVSVDVYATLLNNVSNSTLLISDSEGKIIYKEKLNSHTTLVNINTAAYANGVYFISLKSKESILASNKFVVAH